MEASAQTEGISAILTPRCLLGTVAEAFPEWACTCLLQATPYSGELRWSRTMLHCCTYLLTLKPASSKWCESSISLMTGESISLFQEVLYCCTAPSCLTGRVDNLSAVRGSLTLQHTIQEGINHGW